MYRIVCVAKVFTYFFIVQNLYAQNPTGVPVLHPKHGFFNSPLDVSMTTGTINIQMLIQTEIKTIRIPGEPLSILVDLQAVTMY